MRKRLLFICAPATAAALIFVGAFIADRSNAVVAAPAPPAVPTIDTARHKQMAAFVGDSWVGGSDMGGRGPENFTELIADHFNWDSRNVGVGGTGYVDDGGRNDRFGSTTRLSAAAGTSPDILFIINGINDLDDVAPDQMPIRVREIRTNSLAAYETFRARLPQTKIVVIGFVPPGDSTALIREVNGILAQQARVAGVDFINPTGGTAPEWFSGANKRFIGVDRYHPTTPGHVVLANTLIPILEQMQAKRWPQVYSTGYWSSDEPPSPTTTNPFVLTAN